MVTDTSLRHLSQYQTDIWYLISALDRCLPDTNTLCSHGKPAVWNACGLANTAAKTHRNYNNKYCWEVVWQADLNSVNDNKPIGGLTKTDWTRIQWQNVYYKSLIWFGFFLKLSPDTLGNCQQLFALSWRNSQCMRPHTQTHTFTLTHTRAVTRPWKREDTDGGGWGKETWERERFC